MKVFKGYMILTKRNLGIILLYFGVFVGITMLIQTSVQKEDETKFSLEQVKITVIDRDKGELAKGLKKYLGINNQLIHFKDDKNTLRDALYYRKTEYIIYVPKQFETQCLNGKEKIGITAVPGTYTESYISYQLDTYLNQVQMYEESGYTLEEAIEKTIHLQEIRPNVNLQAGSNAEFADYMYSFQYFPYLFLSALCCAIGMLLVIFRKEDVKDRISCAPVSPAKRTCELVLALGIISMGLLLFSLLIPILQSSGRMLSDPHIGYLLMNAFLLLLSSMGIAVITGTLVKNASIITNVATTVSLGISFLCGVFVPLDIMGSNVKKVVQILPVYWYETINGLLGNYQVLTDTMKATILKGYLVQAIFAVACVCIAMVISKVQEERA